jgi:hypothetical protein
MAFLLTTMLGSVVSAQTTQPASSWQTAVEQLADAVRGKDIDSLTKLLVDAPILRSFESDRIQPAEKLLGVTSGTTLLGAHAYLQPPNTLATDLAADVQSAAGVPEQVRTAMTPPDEAAAKRANETAQQWLLQVLTPTKDQLVGVIVLWRDERLETLTGVRKRPLFVLVKGERAGETYRLRQIIFGDPLDASR